MNLNNYPHLYAYFGRGRDKRKRKNRRLAVARARNVLIASGILGPISRPLFDAVSQYSSLTKLSMNFHSYPYLYACFAETYTRHRKGRVEVVRKGNNRFKVVARRGNVRVVARGSIPINGGEAMGKLVVGAKRNRRNIKEKFLIDPRRGGVLVKGQGNVGSYQIRGGGFIGWQPGRYRRDAT